MSMSNTGVDELRIRNWIHIPDQEGHKLLFFSNNGPATSRKQFPASNYKYSAKHPKLNMNVIKKKNKGE